MRVYRAVTKLWLSTSVIVSQYKLDLSGSGWNRFPGYFGGKLSGIYRVSQEKYHYSGRSQYYIYVILRRKVYMNMCPIPNGFRYLARSILNLARNILLSSLSMSNHNSQLTLHTDSHASDIDALRWEGRTIFPPKFKILHAKYRKPLGIGHMFIYTFLLRITYYDLPEY
jgi:hypothetical protein